MQYRPILPLLEDCAPTSTERGPATSRQNQITIKRQFKETMMTDQAMEVFERARGRVAGDFRTIINDSEELLKAAAMVSGESFTAARLKFEEKLQRAKAALADASQPIFDKTRETAAVADNYVHGNAWKAVGVAMAAGVVIGFLATKRWAAGTS